VRRRLGLIVLGGRKRPAKNIFRRPRRIRTMVPCSTPGGRFAWNHSDGRLSIGDGLWRAGRPAA